MKGYEKRKLGKGERERDNFFDGILGAICGKKKKKYLCKLPCLSLHIIHTTHAVIFTYSTYTHKHTCLHLINLFVSHFIIERLWQYWDLINFKVPTKRRGL